jgi:hypothetical protein
MNRTLVGGPADGVVVNLHPVCQVYRWTPPRPELSPKTNGPSPLPYDASYRVYEYVLRDCGDMHYAR